jgi:hypothetical protein
MVAVHVLESKKEELRIKKERARLERKKRAKTTIGAVDSNRRL